jgi:DNA-binding response OmpR family regulator
LIVDADPIAIGVMSEVVGLQGFTPMIARTAEEGYEALAEHGQTTALIIVGRALPDMNAETFRQLQMDAPAVASIPTLMLPDGALDDEAAVRLQLWQLCGHQLQEDRVSTSAVSAAVRR